MRMLMPSHAKNVQPYRDNVPVFARFGVEPQLDAMFSPQVTLKSGGYLVINQTEALVAIDVNSGRSTREHNIEDTALATNLEAAEEVARQLRLRDLAGLIVIDFIDMEEPKNNKAVERKLKDCLKNDRARIQVGRISHFGLLEMSRQRIRTGVLEGSTELCPHCLGAGIVRSTESVALHVLRALEDQLLKGVTHHLTVRTRSAVALYILNQKRRHLADLEARFGLTITIAADEHLGTQHFVLERGEIVVNPLPPPVMALTPESVQPLDEDEIEEVVEDDEADEAVASGSRDERGERDENDSRRRRRRRRRRRSDGPEGNLPEDISADVAEAVADAISGTSDGEEAESGDAEADGEGEGETDAQAENRRKSRRRGRRGGRRRHQFAEGAEGEAEARDDEARDDEARDDDEVVETEAAGSEPTEAVVEAEPIVATEPVVVEGTEVAEPVVTSDEPAAVEPVVEAAPAPALESVADLVEKSVANAAEEEAQRYPESEPEPELEDSNHPKKTGWWQRRSFF
jgi:ribonuclease E